VTSQYRFEEKETLYNNENINPTLIWELIKSDIRGYVPLPSANMLLILL
jgi:hypothetical protein